MECSQVRVILFENPDTDIPAEVREGVEAHLAGCPSCARQFQDLKEQLQALGSMPRMEAPRDFVRQVRSRVEKPSALRDLKDRLGNIFGGRRFFQFAGVAATAAVVMLVAQVALKEGTVQKAVLSPHSPVPTAPSSEPLEPEPTSPPLASPAPAVPAPSAEQTGRAATPPPLASRPQALNPPSPKELPGSMPDASRMERAYTKQRSEAKSMSQAAKQAPSVSLTLRPRRPGRPGGFGRTSDSSLKGGRTSDSSFKGGGTNDSPLEGGGGGVSSYKAKSPPRGGFAADRAEKSRAKTASPREEASLPRALPDVRDIYSEVTRLVLDADGNIISSVLPPDEKKPETLVAEMPAANYPPFLGRLDQLGEVSPSAKENAVPPSGSKVRVKIKFDMRQ